jgi:subtilisin-like proprotein convertase family protein
MKKVILYLITILNCSTILYPQWVSDPSINLPICTVAETQREARICNDGAGNIFIFWRDYRNEPTLFGGDIFAQKLDMSGLPLWGSNGNSIISGFGGQFDLKVISDGEQGAYLVWRTSPNSFQNYSLHAQRINNSGNKLWGSSNVTIQSGLGTTLWQFIVMNEDGDLLITWPLDLAAPNSMDIYVQKVDKDGNIKWGSNGLPVCLTTGLSLLGSKIISDGNGGAFVCWSDNRSGGSNSDIYAQRISSSGTPLWTANGIPICTKAESQNTIGIISDQNGGAIIFWEDIQSSTYNICAQRIDSTGNKLWEPDGRVLYSTTNPFSQIEFVLDKNKEIFFLWSTLEGNIYAQKVDYNGNLVWASPVTICATQSSVSYLAASKSDINGIVIVWLDNRNVNYDLYSQWISADGFAKWNDNGVAICNETHEQSDYSITFDRFGGSVIAWADMRNGNYDIYAQNIDSRGKLGTNRYQFNRNGLNKTISNTNPAGDTLLISLPGLKETGYYSVTVNIDSLIHPAVNELTIKLTHLTTTDTVVFNLNSGENFIGTFLDDYALDLLTSGIPPYTGFYKPYKPLSSFINSDLNGEWILTIEDNNIANNGTLKSWGLVFNKGEITDIEYEGSGNTPNNFSLEQNYPNPFNPSTRIQYQVSSITHVTLKVYDILGNEIATLVNEEKPAGKYEVEFQAAVGNRQLASGIYFYQLLVSALQSKDGKAGEFIQTKKMILIK